MCAQRHGFSLAHAVALVLPVALGCGVHDSAGKDSVADAAAAKRASRVDAGANHGAAGNPGTGGRSAAAGAAANAGRSGGAGTTGNPGNVGRAGSTGTGGSGSASDGGAATDGGTPIPQTPEDPDCDLNGIWIARLTTFSRDSVFNSVQTASNWFYYELSQSGREVKVEAELDCGIQVSGSADVTINRATTEALLTKNDQTGRHGTFAKEGDHCALHIDRFYSTRGVPRATYLPADLSQNPELSTLTPALPTEAMPDGNEDWDGDGNPGIAFNVSGLGTRHVAQRDWNEFFSDADHRVALKADELVVRATFDSQEQILATSGALGGLLRAGASPASDGLHRITFRRLGRDKSAPAVTAVRVADALQSCFNVQDALPHDPASM
jgi:hypothetical protein